jgi:3-dehydroquinate synthase
VSAGQIAAIITDSNVNALYGEKVERQFSAAGFRVCKFVIKPGESSKSLKTFSEILAFLCENQVRRTDVIAALGGGVVGDIAGFAAASYLRGINFVQIPTTLVAITDSSVGGKTGANLASGKNLVGAIYQPSLVIADTETLATLPEAEIKNGKGEIIKYGILAGGKLWGHVKSGEFTIEEVLAQCINCKKEIVEADEREANTRRLLNLGHTFGHAIELLSNYKIPHGLAVAAGIKIIARASVTHAGLSENAAAEIEDVLCKNDLVTRHNFSAEKLCQAAASDKKAGGGQITLVLIKEIGKCLLENFKIENLTEVIK